LLNPYVHKHLNPKFITRPKWEKGLMTHIEKLHHQKNKLGHPTIEDISSQHQHILNEMLTFPSKNNLDITEQTISALRTPNDLYKEYLLQQLKTYKENSVEDDE